MFDGVISAAVALQELGIIGILALSNFAWFWIAKRLWDDRNDQAKKLYECMRSKNA